MCMSKCVYIIVIHCHDIVLVTLVCMCPQELDGLGLNVLHYFLLYSSFDIKGAGLVQSLWKNYDIKISAPSPLLM